MPQPMVRQLTARRLVENSATMPKKQKTPAKAWMRGPAISCKRYAALPTSTIPAAMPARQVHGVGGSGGAGVTTTGGSDGDGMVVMASELMKPSYVGERGVLTP